MELTTSPFITSNNLVSISILSSVDDVSKGKYGILPLIRSEKNPPKQTFSNVSDLNKTEAGKTVWVRGRLHAVRARGKQCFAVLRQRECTVQVIVNVSDTVSKAMVKFVSR